MTAIFGIPLLIGLVVMGAWVAATAIAATVDGWEHVDPERRFGRGGRFVLAGLIGFGMAGISTLYAGWPQNIVIVGGVAGAIGLIFVSIWLGPDTES